MQSGIDMIPAPHDITEAGLLLVTTCADCRIQVTERDLADQVMQRYIL